MERIAAVGIDTSSRAFKHLSNASPKIDAVEILLSAMMEWDNVGFRGVDWGIRTTGSAIQKKALSEVSWNESRKSSILLSRTRTRSM